MAADEVMPIMNKDVLLGILIPFIGTAAGAGCVFFMKKDLSRMVQRSLTGFASGADRFLARDPVPFVSGSRCAPSEYERREGGRPEKQAQKDDYDGACRDASQYS